MKRISFARSLSAAPLAAGAIRPRCSVAADAPIPLRVGTLPVDAASTALCAQDMGYYEQAGLAVKLSISTSGGSVMLAALLGNQLDICGSSNAAVMLARNRGIKVRFVAPGAMFVAPYPPNSALLVGKDSPIHAVADIVGKTIAVAALKDITQYSVQAWIAAGGGTPESVRYIEIPYPAMAPALAQGRVDAICLPEPFLTKSKNVARVLVNLDAVISKRYLIAGWIATDDWLEQNPEARDRFIKATQRSARWVNTHRAESAAILVKYSGIEPAVVAAMTRAVQDESDRVDPRLVQDPLNMMIKYGGVSSRVTTGDLVWSPDH